MFSHMTFELWQTFCLTKLWLGSSKLSLELGFNLGPSPVFDPPPSALVKVLLCQLIQSPRPWYLITLDRWSNFSSLTLGLSSARILLSQFSKYSLSFPLIFVIFHPRNPSLCSLIINAKLSLLCLELSPISSPCCNITTAKVLKSPYHF